MQHILRAAVRDIHRASSRRLRQLVLRLDPVEREFQRLWPYIDRVEGQLVSPAQERWLFQTAKALPPEATIVEIGSWKGRSTCALAYGCRGTTKQVFAIDTFTDSRQDFQRNIDQCGLSAYVTPIPGWSTEVAKTWQQPIHFLFIDASQEYEDVLADFANFFPHVVPGGMIALHDVHTRLGGPIAYPGVLQVWHEVASLVLVELGACSSLAFGRKALWPGGGLPPGGKGAILLVEEDELHVRVGQTKLQHLGYRVAGFTQSREALEAFGAAPAGFELVMIGPSLSPMAGEALAGQVRRRRADIPILLCTDDRHTIDAEHAQALGIDVFSPKTTGLHELGVAILRTLAQRRYAG